MLRRLLAAWMLLFTWVCHGLQGPPDCPFDKARVINQQVVLSGRHARVIINKWPATPGHLMAIPIRCVERYDDLTVAELAEINQMIKLSALAIDSVYQVSDYLVLQKNGADAGQSVAHVHFHIIPAPPGEKETIIKRTFNFIEREELVGTELEQTVGDLRSFYAKTPSQYWPSINARQALMQPNYTHVLFDVGHVLIRAKYRYEDLPQTYDLSADTIKRAVTGNAHYQYCKGMINSDQYYQSVVTKLRQFNGQASLALPQQTLKDYLDRHILEQDDDAVNLLQRFRAMGKKIIIVTDTHAWQSESFRQRLALDELADQVFESHLVGKLKAEVGYFTDLLKQLNIEGPQAILIDDKLANNEQARRAGIFAPGYLSAAQVTQVLKQQGYF